MSSTIMGDELEGGAPMMMAPAIALSKARLYLRHCKIVEEAGKMVRCFGIAAFLIQTMHFRSVFGGSKLRCDMCYLSELMSFLSAGCVALTVFYLYERSKFKRLALQFELNDLREVQRTFAHHGLLIVKEVHLLEPLSPAEYQIAMREQVGFAVVVASFLIWLEIVTFFSCRWLLCGHT